MKKAVAVGATVQEQYRILLLVLKAALIQRLGVNFEIDSQVIINKFGSEAKLRIGDLIDFFIFMEVFVDEVYSVSSRKNPEVIFDVGSNTGISVVYFRLKYPSAEIFAFEPDPRNFDRLKETTLNLQNIHIFNCAISEKDGVEGFFISSNPWSSSLKERDSSEKIRVPVRSIESFAQEWGIEKVDVMKFDIEGAETELFKGVKKESLIDTFIGEVHWDLIEDKKELLKELERFNWIEKNKGARRSIILGRS